MDIEDLESIRDFCDHISLLEKDIGSLALAMEETSAEENDIYANCAWAICHQAELLEKLFNQFKKSVDEKYWAVWQAAHAQLNKDYKEANNILDNEELKKKVKETILNNEGKFPKIDAQAKRIQEELDEK